MNAQTIEVTQELDAAIAETPFKYAVRIVNEISRQMNEQRQAEMAKNRNLNLVPQETAPVEEAQPAVNQG